MGKMLWADAYPVSIEFDFPIIAEITLYRAEEFLRNFTVPFRNLDSFMLIIKYVAYFIKEYLDVFVYDKIPISVVFTFYKKLQIGVNSVEHYQLPGCQSADRTASGKTLQMDFEKIFRCKVENRETCSYDVYMEIVRLFDNVERNMWADDQEVAALHLVFLQPDLDCGCASHADCA